MTQTVKIPERYAALGVKHGFDPTDPANLRMIVESEPGHGKTTFLMSMPDVLVLDFDRACEDALSPRASYMHIPSWEHYVGVKAALLDDAKKGNRPYRRIGFDTVDNFMALLDAHLIADINERRPAGKQLHTIYEFGEKGAGYSKMCGALLRELADFDRAGYPYILNTHMRLRITTIGEKQFIERRSSMAPMVMEALIKNTDIKARMSRSLDDVIQTTTKQISLPGGKTKTITSPTGEVKANIRYWLGLMPQKASEQDNDTKRRIPTLEGILEIPLVHGWDVFATAYAKAVENAKSLVALPEKGAL